MIKEQPVIVLEPFLDAEVAALDEKLASLSMLELKSYIASAKSSLQNQALSPTWRPRIELGMQHAQEALVRGEAAAVAAGIQTSDASLEVVSQVTAAKKAKKGTKAAAKAPVAVAEPEPETEAEVEVEEEPEA